MLLGQIRAHWWLKREDWLAEMVAAWHLTQRRGLLAGIIDKAWYLGERLYHWWDGPYISRVPIAPPGDMFWGRELAGEELIEVERGYPSESLLDGAHFSYVCTLIPQLIDVVVSDFIPPTPPPETNPVQPSSSRGGTSQAS